MSQVHRLQESANERLSRQLQWCLQMFEDLQESSLAGNRDAVTSSDIMDIDWSLSRRDDVMVNDDFPAKNLDNDRDSTQWKDSRKLQDVNNRKLSFGIFKKDRDPPPPRGDSVAIREESVADRRPPKRFFSQQNLKAIPKDAEVCEGYTASRFHPSRFLWRFTSNQKIKSNNSGGGGDNNCGSSLSLNQQKVPVIEELSAEVEYQSSGERCYPVDESTHRWSGEDSGGDYQTEAPWKGGMERRSRCQSLSVLPEASISSVLDHHSSAAPSTGSCCPQWPRPSVLGGEFCSTRCLGDYRPCLNTHYEEPTGGETVKQRWLNDGTHQNRTMKEGEEAGPVDSYERQMETRQHFRASVGDLDLTWTTEGSSKSTRMFEPDVRSKFRIFPEENGKPDLVAMTTTTAHFQSRSPLSAGEIERASAATAAIRSDAAIIRDKTTLEQDIGVPLQGESHARTIRRLSKELYSEHHQSKTLPHSCSVTSPFKKPQQHQTSGENNKNNKAKNFTVGRSNGYTMLPTKTFSPSTKTPRSHFSETPPGSVPGQFGYFHHSRSLSMSQLQGSNTTHQWPTRDGYNAVANTRVATSGPSDSGDYDLIGGNRYSSSDFNVETTRPPSSLPGGVCHQRGGSLDSNETGRLAYERGSLAPYSTAPRQTCDGETKGVFSLANRLGFNEDDHPPSRYDIYQPQTGDSQLIPAEKTNHPVSASKQLQQQAVVNLFQKLSALKQQKQQVNGHSRSGSYELAQPSSSNTLSSQQVESSSGSSDKWKGLPCPTTRPCHPGLNPPNRYSDMSANVADVRADMSTVENHESRSKIPSQQSLIIEYGQELRIIKKGHYSDGIVPPRLSASQTEDGCKQPLSPLHSHPTHPEIPPKAAAAAAATAARHTDVGSSSASCYVDRLRQEARKQTKSAAAAASSAVAGGSPRSNSEPHRMGADDVRRRPRGHEERRHSDGAELRKADCVTTTTTTDQKTASFNNTNNRSTENESANDTEGMSLCVKTPVRCEYHRKDESFGENETSQLDKFSQSEIQKNFAIESHAKEIDNIRTDPIIPHNKFSHCVPGGKATNVPNDLQTDGNATRCTDRCLPLSESNNKEAKTVAASTDCRQHLGSLGDILRDLPDEEEEAYLPEEDERFRSLSAVLCRHHPEAGGILAPVCVRAGASFVRRMLFEGQKSAPELEDSFQAIVDLRPKDDFNKNGNGIKDSTLSGDSLQTLKDELLSLADERLQRQTEKTEQLMQLNVRTLLLENKVIELVRGKVDSKQLEKFLSYLEQLEKVVQLFLNLSSRLSSVEESICQNQRESDGDDQREQKRHNDKRLQILLRLKEAMELKSSIDARSEQVCAHLDRHLTPTEFDDFRSLVRNRCQLLIQRQAVEDRKQLIVLQKKFLTDQTSRAKSTCRSVDDSNLLTNEKNMQT